MYVFRYPPEIEDFVREWSPKMRDQELALKVNEKFGTSFTAKSIKAYRGNHKIRNFKKQLSHEEYWKYQTKYPKGMYEFIRDNSWNVGSKKMAEMVEEKFGYHFSPVGMKQFRQRHGIKSGCKGWYQKGHPPGTKGKTIEEICKFDEEKLERVKSTQFKTGNRPSNELPVGALSINKDGYVLRKKQMEGGTWDRWEFLHRAVWVEHNGPVPEGMNVTFKDGNKLNCDINNLILMTRGELANMNKKGYFSEDPERTVAALNLVRLKKAAASKQKERRKKREKTD